MDIEVRLNLKRAAELMNVVRVEELDTNVCAVVALAALGGSGMDAGFLRRIDEPRKKDPDYPGLEIGQLIGISGLGSPLVVSVPGISFGEFKDVLSHPLQIMREYGAVDESPNLRAVGFLGVTIDAYQPRESHAVGLFSRHIVPRDVRKELAPRGDILMVDTSQDRYIGAARIRGLFDFMSEFTPPNDAYLMLLVNKPVLGKPYMEQIVLG